MELKVGECPSLGSFKMPSMKKCVIPIVVSEVGDDTSACLFVGWDVGVWTMNSVDTHRRCSKFLFDIFWSKAWMTSLEDVTIY
jgi:hypothetical protein